MIIIIGVVIIVIIVVIIVTHSYINCYQYFFGGKFIFNCTIEIENISP